MLVGIVLAAAKAEIPKIFSGDPAVIHEAESIMVLVQWLLWLRDIRHC